MVFRNDKVLHQQSMNIIRKKQNLLQIQNIFLQLKKKQKLRHNFKSITELS